jgi:hypothetical protein
MRDIVGVADDPGVICRQKIVDEYLGSRFGQVDSETGGSPAVIVYPSHPVGNSGIVHCLESISSGNCCEAPDGEATAASELFSLDNNLGCIYYL